MFQRENQISHLGTIADSEDAACMETCWRGVNGGCGGKILLLPNGKTEKSFENFLKFFSVLIMGDSENVVRDLSQSAVSILSGEAGFRNQRNPYRCVLETV